MVMPAVQKTQPRIPLALALLVLVVAAFAGPMDLDAQASNGQNETTFTKDIAPILQGHCQRCHRDEGVAPMPLTTYEQVKPWAAMMIYKTELRDRAGAMPPWYVEKDIGIQDYKDDPSLDDEQIATIRRWAQSGAPEGDPADMPPPLVFDDVNTWLAGEPDIIVRLEDVEVASEAPDWWGNIPSVPTGLTEDRYVASVEVKEINDVDTKNATRSTVGGRYVVHHMIWSTQVLRRDRRARPGRAVRELARARGGSQPGRLRSGRGQAAQGRLKHHVQLDPPTLEWQRHQSTSGDRVPPPSEGL